MAKLLLSWFYIIVGLTQLIRVATLLSKYNGAEASTWLPPTADGVPVVLQPSSYGSTLKSAAATAGVANPFRFNVMGSNPPGMMSSSSFGMPRVNQMTLQAQALTMIDTLRKVQMAKTSPNDKVAPDSAGLKAAQAAALEEQIFQYDDQAVC